MQGQLASISAKKPFPLSLSIQFFYINIQLNNPIQGVLGRLINLTPIKNYNTLKTQHNGVYHRINRISFLIQN